MFKNLRPGQRVTFLVPNGIGRNGQEWKKKTGRVVMVFDTHAVINGGGRFGTPHVVTDQNFVGAGS